MSLEYELIKKYNDSDTICKLHLEKFNKKISPRFGIYSCEKQLTIRLYWNFFNSYFAFRGINYTVTNKNLNYIFDQLKETIEIEYIQELKNDYEEIFMLCKLNNFKPDISDDIIKKYREG
jgi:hypothetical protein